MSFDARDDIDWKAKDFWNRNPWEDDEDDPLTQVDPRPCDAPKCRMDALTAHTLCGHHMHRCPQCMAPAEPTGTPCARGEMFVACDEGHVSVIPKPAWMTAPRRLRSRGFY